MDLLNLFKRIKQAQIFYKTQTLKRGEEFCNSISCKKDILFIESGSVAAYINLNNEEQIIRFAYDNDIIVPIDSFLQEKNQSMFNFKTLKKTKIYHISKNEFFSFIQKNQMENIWTEILETLVLQQLEREIDLLTTSPKDRYLRVFRRNPKLFQYIPNRYIANYLKMSPETLSRLKKSLISINV